MRTGGGRSDAELVAGVVAGSRGAADRLARRHMPGCRAVALAITGDPALADDLAQDAFVAAIEQIETCRRPERFGPWIAQITRNRARDELKSRRHRDSVSIEGLTLAAGGDSPERSAVLGELRRRLVTALAQLPEAQREAVLLHDVEGWKHREIAQRLDLPHGTVRSHVHHARRKLRELLDEDLEGG